MVSKFEDLVEALAVQVKGGPLSDDEKVDLIDAVEDNGLDDPEALPPWLASLFDALVNHEALPTAPQNAGAKPGGSAHNFLYELSELLVARRGGDLVSAECHRCQASERRPSGGGRQGE